MKIKFVLLILFSTVLSVQGQTPSLYLKYTNSSTPFGQNIPVGTQIIDLDSMKQYVTLQPLPAATPPGTNIRNSVRLLLDDSNKTDADPTKVAQLREINVNGSAYHVGDLFGGGIIASVWRQDGVEHGIIVSLMDLTAAGGIKTSTWDDIDLRDSGDPPYPVDGTWDATSKIDGNYNCGLILGNVTGAVALSQNYSNDGYTDWYLPAVWEVISVFGNVGILNAVLSPLGFDVFVPDRFYWTSTEDADSFSSAVQFKNNGIISSNAKNSSQYVRAVRRF